MFGEYETNIKKISSKPFKYTNSININVHEKIYEYTFYNTNIIILQHTSYTILEIYSNHMI